MTQNETLVKGGRYSKEGNKICLKVKIKTAQQLFDSRDPAPFRERDLDDDFVDYIISSAEEFSARTEFKIVIQMNKISEDYLSVKEIQEAFQMNFSYRHDLLQKKQSKMFKMAQLFFVIGLFSLAFFTFLSEVLANYSQGAMLKFFKEGLIIVGWVILWRPIELVLFDWIPLYEKRRLFSKLAKTPVSVVYED